MGVTDIPEIDPRAIAFLPDGSPNPYQTVSPSRSTPDPTQLTGQEQAVLAAVIAPIARRMALVAARKAQEAVCDEILRRLEAEIGETFGMSKITGVANMVRAVRANPPQIVGM